MELIGTKAYIAGRDQETEESWFASTIVIGEGELKFLMGVLNVAMSKTEDAEFIRAICMTYQDLVKIESEGSRKVSMEERMFHLKEERKDEKK